MPRRRVVHDDHLKSEVTLMSLALEFIMSDVHAPLLATETNDT